MRLPEFQQYLETKNIDLVFLNSLDSSLTYFAQTKLSHGFLIITPHVADLYITSLDSVPHTKRINVQNIPKEWQKKFSNNNIRRVGINTELLPVGTLEKLRKVWPKAKFVDISKKIKQLRSTKNAEEVRRITKACEITASAFNALIEELPKKTLKTEQEVADFLEKEFRKNNATSAFPIIVAMGKHAAIPHHITSNQKLKKGFLLIDFGAKYKNYCSDMTRVIYLGKANNEEKQFYHLLLQSQLEAISHIQHNRSFKKLDNIARNNLAEYSSHFIHSLGHGIGIDVHESPSFFDNSRINHNQVFTIEPGIYFPGKFGLRIEDTVHFNNKVTVLTKAPKDLIEITIK